MQVTLVTVSEVDKIWEAVAPFLLSSVNRPENDNVTDMPYLWTNCRRGEAFLIIAFNADPFEILMASVWEFEQHDYWSFRCIALGAKKKSMKLWLNDARAFVTKVAKINGVFSIMARGRGWNRVFREAVPNGIDYEVILT